MASIKIIGQSARGLPLVSYIFGSQGPTVLILGGVHGDEPEGVCCAWGLFHEFSKNFPFKLRVILIPQLNADGCLHGTRWNGNGVDLNRNLPTRDWTPVASQPRYSPGPSALSEPENKALVALIDQEKPSTIISLHSWNPLLNINGPARPLAEVIAQYTGYIITEDIGYPTPGSLGTYAGHERKIPTLTYEIQRDLDDISVLKIHVKSVIEGLKSLELHP